MDLEKPIIGDDTQVSQSIGAWEIVGNRVKGEILFIAQNSFNPYYYNKSVVHLLQIKNKDGIVLGMKTNDLTFSDLQRDERLTFDENAEFNKELIIESYVWSSVQDSLALSTKKEFSVVETVKVVTDPETGEQLTVAQSQTRVKPDKRNDWLGKATGIFAGLAGISLLLGDRGK
jgi:hypothetical protein